MQNDQFGHVGKNFSKKILFAVCYSIQQKHSFKPIFNNWYLSYEKNTFANNLRVEPTILFMEKISLSFKFFSGHILWAIVH